MCPPIHAGRDQTAERWRERWVGFQRYREEEGTDETPRIDAGKSDSRFEFNDRRLIYTFCELEDGYAQMLGTLRAE